MRYNDSLKHIRTLIIDNYDSYTFNLLQLIDCQVAVIRNDQFTWEEFSTKILPNFDSVIISPGPGRPEREKDFGICTPLLKAQLDPQQVQLHRPIFGICLGHQGIGYLMGGKVTYAPRIMHGRMSEVHCIKQQSNKNTIYGDIFDDCALPFWAVRYHSLVVDPSTLPSCLLLTAYCEEDDADMEALKNSSFLSDDNNNNNNNNNDRLSGDHRHHYLQHPSSSKSHNDTNKEKSITVMGFQHTSLPLWGVQFHPESVSTEHGQMIMDKFISETDQWMKKVGRPMTEAPLDSVIQAYSVSPIPQSHQQSSLPEACTTSSTPPEPTSSFTLHVKRCFPNWVDSEYMVEDLLGGNIVEGLNVKSISWLDSSRESSPYSQMSILSVDPAMTLRYSTLHRQINIQDRLSNYKQHTISLQNDHDTFFDYISRWMKRIGHNIPVSYTADQKQYDNDGNVAQPQLAFLGGLIGYFGYEMKRESMDGYQTPKEQQCKCTQHSENTTGGDGGQGSAHCCECMEEPDAAFHFVDRFWVFDHSQRQVYVCGLLNEKGHNNSDTTINGLGFNGMNDMLEWMGSAEKMILHTTENIRRRQRVEEFISLTPISSTCTTPIPKSMLLDQPAPAGSDLFTANVQHDAYLESIQQCVQQIKEGESYEICLTTRFRLALEKEDDDDNSGDEIYPLWKLYTHHLRKNNPAPFSALLHFPGDCDRLPAFGLLSSSPERFLKVQDGVAEMKPIKGTMARALQCQCPPHECDFGLLCEQLKSKEEQVRKQRLWEDVKERAENLMIVDLIRNDLSQVCDPNSVQVPKLMHVETYEKVHHLVSTVCGKLQPNVTSVDAVKKCFPPGSMTGAPKLRSVQLLDQLEHQKRRGVYSGCLGYLSLGGSADFNVVIRTAVATMKSNDEVELSVGGGGAITFLSNPEQEWKETLLKTKSVAPSVKEYLEQKY